MPVPVNLYVDRLSMTPPNDATQVYYATSDHPGLYAEAAKRIGLTPAEYAEFRRALLEGNAPYVRLPRRLDSMAGVHRKHGHAVYAIDNVLVPTNTMGWKVQLADGTQVYVPQICGNLSMIRHGAIAKRPARRAVAAVPVRRPVKRVAAEVVTRQPAPAPVTPVTFDNPAQVAAVPVPVTPAATGGSRRFFPALLLPLVGLFHGGGGSGGGGGVAGPPPATSEVCPPK